MEKSTSTAPEEVRASLSTIYSDILSKRRADREYAEEQKRLKREEKEQRKAEQEEKDEIKMSKKERQQAALDNWKDIIVGLTGDDLEYTDEKKGKKKKYRQWIDDNPSTKPQDMKPKKVKKKNYQKEFEPELQMLKSLVADQNRFTAELLKRYNNAVGPNTKDAMPPNKTIVELISTINNSRANALGMLREISGIKRNIADLYMKQKKLDYDLGNSNGSNVGNDLALMGSNIANSIFGDMSSGAVMQSSPLAMGSSSDIGSSMATPSNGGFVQATAAPMDINNVDNSFQAEAFDPSTWDGGDIQIDNSTKYEAIPHHTEVLWDKENGKAKFVAVRDDTGELLEGAPVPTTDPSRLSFNESNGTVKGDFDQVYPLRRLDKEPEAV